MERKCLFCFDSTRTYQHEDTHTHTHINEIRKTTNITYSFFVFCCVRSYPEIAKFSFSPVFLKIPRLPRFSAQLRKMSPRQRLSLKIADPLDYSRQSSYFLVGYYYPRSRLRPVIWRARYADNQRHWRILTRLTVAAVPYGVRCEDCCCSLPWVYGEIPRTPSLGRCRGPRVQAPISRSISGFQADSLMHWPCTYT